MGRARMHPALMRGGVAAALPLLLRCLTSTAGSALASVLVRLRVFSVPGRDHRALCREARLPPHLLLHLRPIALIHGGAEA